ncbi:choice-of-anchor B family protein [Marixanthomonas ophiurae]|uniref:Choice-of-anchor B family protein n=1 Tax=Marixanthomonas ophiurae TaxID=387659 RepID=A0A3E1QA66_9FLAO|nr:choice-of-anchor B family protein [Marixanthomonas ophiurae]RFN59017.1 choice-of-anchor B family protein [Marixanthomonas ophiurae]
MKKSLLTLLILACTQVFAQTPCNNGMAGQYPCNGYDLQSRVSLSDMNANAANDSWGWTDPQDGKEYAIIGLEGGTTFIDISNPTNPIYLGKLPTHSFSSNWRDVKTYNNHAFIVSEDFSHGMQVFDLTRLRNVSNPPVTFTEDAHYDGFGNAHNIVINEDSGYAYAVGTSTYSGGSHFINIQDPTNPVAAGGFGGDGYTHDAQVITYNGPDSDYTGREILLSSSGNENYVSIVDVTDKANPQSISTISYLNSSYTHQGWFTEDQRYFILGDEIDEQDFGFNTRTIIFDLTDLDNPVLDFEHFGETEATDHNGYVLGDNYYLANYAAGLRVLDISDIANGNISEVGYFDSFSAHNSVGYEGVWNVYPYLGSGNIIISDRVGGLFVVKSSAPDTTDPVAICQNTSVSLDSNGEIIIDPALLDGGSSDDSGSFSLSLSENTFTCSDIGENTVTLTVTDPSGNTDACTAIITIEDNTDPIITCTTDTTVEYDSGASFYTLPNYEAEGLVLTIDNCSQNPTVTQTPVAGTELTEGIYTIDFQSEDAAGNTGNCSFELTVIEELSINDNTFENSIKVFPVPALNEINITSENKTIEFIDVYDIMGKKVYTEKNINTTKKTINISSFSKGMYFLSINNKATKKIVKK